MANQKALLKSGMKSIVTHNTTMPWLSQLEIKHECERLVLQAVFLFDSRRFREWSELFTEDGEITYQGQAERHVGPASLCVVAEKAPPATTVHVVTSHLVDVVGEDAAEGTAYVTLFLAPPCDDGPVVMSDITPTIIGIYRDVYRDTADGWRFARRSFQPIIATSEILKAYNYEVGANI